MDLPHPLARKPNPHALTPIHRRRPMHFRALDLPLAALLLASAACATAIQSADVDEPSPSPAEVPAEPAAGQRADSVALRLVSSRAGSEDYAALGLTGANKPNGAGW